MRTRGAGEDLVVVDLDDPDGIEGRDPAAQRRRFEDRYAELPFGLGTVPRRLDHDPWYVRPGVVLWIAIALIGLLALAGRDGGGTDHGAGAPPPDPGPTYPVLTEKTGVHLLFTHLDVTSDFDVDSGVFRVAGPVDLLHRPAPLRPLIVDWMPADARGRHALVVRGATGLIRSSVVTTDGEALAVGTDRVVWRSARCERCTIYVTDVRTARTTALGRARGAPTVSLAPDGKTVALLAYVGPGRLALRLMRASGRRVAEAELPTDVAVAPLLWSRDSRWLFTVRGATLLAIDRSSGDVRRVGNTLPPFESLETA